MQTIGEHIARIKNNFKLTSADTVITDRFIYLLMKKHRDFVVKRDKLQKLIVQDNLYQTKHLEELKKVDSVEACGIESACHIKRTVNKIPELMEGDYGVLLRWVGSLDGVEEIKHINASAFHRKLRKPTAKYNKEKYYWYKNGYLYFPNVNWDGVLVEGYFKEDVFNDCDESNCVYMPEQMFRMPDYLVSSMDQLIYQDLSMHVQLMYDENINDNENIK